MRAAYTSHNTPDRMDLPFVHTLNMQPKERLNEQ
jgi:hypothetical protein